MKELVEERNETQKVFDLGGGVKKYYIHPHDKPIHYKENGAWVPFSSELEGNKIIERSYTAHLLEEGKVGYAGTDKETGEEMYLELDGNYSYPEILGNKVLYKNVAPDTDFRLTFHDEFIMAAVILKSKDAPREFKYTSKGNRPLIHKGWDNKRRAVRLDVKTGDGTIVQKWDGTVIDIDPVTRRRSINEDVEYPVVIDPTSTFSIYGTSAHSGVVTQVVGTMSTITGRSTGNNTDKVNSSSTGGTVKTNRQNWPYMVFRVNGFSNSTSITSAELSVRMKWQSFDTGSAEVVNSNQPTAGEKMRVFVYNGVGPTSSGQTDQYNLIPQTMTTSVNMPVGVGKVAADTGFTQAYSGLDTSWPWGGSSWNWRTKTIDVTGKVQSMFNTFHYDNDNDMLFIWEAVSLSFKNTTSTTTSGTINAVSGEKLSIAQKRHVGQSDPQLIIVTGGAPPASNPMKIVFS